MRGHLGDPLRRRLLLGVIVCALVGPSAARAQTNVVSFEAVTMAATSIGFAAATLRPSGSIVGVTVCSGKLENGPIRYRYDGTDPTASIGLVADVGDVITVSGQSALDLFRGIRVGAVSGVVQFTCSRLADSTVTVAGTFAQYPEDSAHVSGDKGFLPLAVRGANCSSPLSGSNGDYNPFQTDGFGSVCVNIATNGAGSATDTDDGSIASSQANVALVAGLQMYYNGTVWVRVTPSPCTDASLLTTVAISQTADTKVISAVSGKKNYICNLVVVASAAEIVGLVEGTGSTCGTGTAALIGSTTDANSMSFAANGGVSLMGGAGGILKSAGSNVDVCLMNSGSNRITGFLTYAQL